MKMPLVVGLLLGGAQLCGAEEPAPPARCKLMVIDATDGPKGMDAKIPASLRSQLDQPPYSHWKSFKVTVDKEEQVARGGTASYALPDNGKATVTYTEHQQGPDGKHVIRGTLDMTHPKVKTNFKLDEGRSFLTVDTHDKHGHIISLSCKAEH